MSQNKHTSNGPRTKHNKKYNTQNKFYSTDKAKGDDQNYINIYTDYGDKGNHIFHSKFSK